MKKRVIGCNLGQVSIGVVELLIAEDGNITFKRKDHLVHNGRPIEILQDLYAKDDFSSSYALGVTGIYSNHIMAPIHSFMEDACLEEGLLWDERTREVKGNLNLLSIGARGYSVLTRKNDNQFCYLENDKCSSGAGENIQRMADRFALNIGDADELAMHTSKGLPITARCSVFAKSEITHWANQGRGQGELLKGYFAQIASNLYGLWSRNNVDGPTFMTGAPAQIKSLKGSLEEFIGQKIFRPNNYLIFEALGAAHLALKKGSSNNLPKDPKLIISLAPKPFRILTAPSKFKEKVIKLKRPTEVDPLSLENNPCVLGLDLGSTGAKGALVSIRTGNPLFDVYDSTRGDPLGASKRLIQALMEKIPKGDTVEIKAIGVTGSGRGAVSTLIQTVFGSERPLLILNEIVAHARAAIFYDPDKGKDLSIIEIGGQDAKYIRLQDGLIVESDMNKACSAGTGSFLDEQATLYGLDNIHSFANMARCSQNPPDLGQMCTVYISEAASKAILAGFKLEDILAGLQYSVLHNYLNRVMGNRKLAKNIFFQGKPASNTSLAWTLASITDQNVMVPHNPGFMGAFGIALATIDKYGSSRLLGLQSLPWFDILKAKVVERKEFSCSDPKCDTCCPIERTTIQVGEKKKTTLLGGACPKYEPGVGELPKLAKEAPNPFVESKNLLMKFHGNSLLNNNIVPMAIPRSGALFAYIPFLSTLVTQMGFRSKILYSNEKSLARGEQLAISFDSCSPCKIAHALCDQDIPLVFFPKIVGLNHKYTGIGPGTTGQTCLTEQTIPDIIKWSNKKITLIRPILNFNKGFNNQQNLSSLKKCASEFKIDPNEFDFCKALEQASIQQEEYEKQLQEIGKRAIRYARDLKIPMVLLGGPLHVIHDKILNSSIPQILRQNGVMGIPLDCFPIDEEISPMELVYWGDHNRYLRAAQQARNMGDVYPLMLSSFGCGPASFNEQIFQELLKGYPHTILESDGHGGVAGFVTRIQAFLHSITKSQKYSNSSEVRIAERPRLGGPFMSKKVDYVFLSGINYLGQVIAAVYRSFGYSAVVAPPFSIENLASGQKDCNGKECLSYQMVWGAFKEYLENNPPKRKTRLIQLGGQSCRASLFGVKDRINLEKLGLDKLVNVAPLHLAGGPLLSLISWLGIVATDIIRQLHVYYQQDDLYQYYSQKIVDICGRQVEPRLLRQYLTIKKIVREASLAFMKENDNNNDHYLRLFVSGDILTKGNDFANGNLFPFLHEQKVKLVIEPCGDFIEYLASTMPHLIFGTGGDEREQAEAIKNMTRIRQDFYTLIRKNHPWIPLPKVDMAMKMADAILDKSTNARAVLTIGNVLMNWKSKQYDGILITSCWGCDNGLVEEGLLRSQKNIPSYFFYDDGFPIDKRRLTRFTGQIQRNPVKHNSSFVLS